MIAETFKRLAHLLKLRRGMNARPYNLLLTSTLSLTPRMLQTICHSDDWPTFCRYLQDLGPHDRLHVLRPLLYTSQHSSGYAALARLIAQRYFSVILTTNIDSELEHALTAILRQSGLTANLFQTLVLGRDTDEHIVRSLDNARDEVYIVKLHGSLQDSALPAAFPDFLELHPPLRTSIQKYLSQDIIIAGSLVYDEDINRALIRAGRESVYYVLPYEPGPDDAVMKLMSARDNSPAAYLIAGQYGDFDTFFPTLESLLSDDPEYHAPAAAERMAPREHGPSSAGSTTVASVPKQSDVARVQWADQADGTQPITVFISYADDDEKFKNQLERHLAMLRRDGLISPWHSRQIEPGQEWEREIADHIDAAQLILLLVSPSFLASDQLYENEMRRAMQRQASGATRVIPIIIRSVDLGQTPFKKLLILPRNGKPVDMWRNSDEAWSNIVQEIRLVCEQLHKSRGMDAPR